MIIAQAEIHGIIKKYNNYFLSNLAYILNFKQFQ